MGSSRRAARTGPETQPAGRTPANLRDGPCVELWADRACRFPLWSAWRNWQDARNAWAEARGLDYRQLPEELRDRAPFFRDTKRGSR